MGKKNILIGITGGIAAYKTLDLIRKLEKENYVVKTILSPNAYKFITKLTVETLSKNKLYNDTLWMESEGLAHIELSAWADLMLIAPLTANTLSKIAHGLADNLLCTTALALPETTPLFIAPAMNSRMWLNKSTQNNLKALEKTHANVNCLLPKEGKLACNETGPGAMMNTLDIYKRLKLKQL